ncbi:TIGR04086 family membrane protein [Salipaludibacillus neizhouensis]|uniref:TIGR04086 family membrane protein n=1 Tax=Salipaludibacillus neizhouensis TaxID=885475 RepID=A0A3A9KCS7_9BACI|nr:TIGR04086 family membrane protein [Salipaludibacillus neizhouensis]RKL68560.1 TIGR04086 family membrane protein [Salipaludibacillus neizhouensis]
MFSHRFISSILYGVLTIFILVIVASFMSSLVLKYTNVTEETFLWILIGFSFLALFIGGFISGGKSGQKGWFAGALTALFYTTLVFLTQYLSMNQGFDSQQLLMHLGYFIVAILGGIMGVNVRGNSFAD